MLNVVFLYSKFDSLVQLETDSLWGQRTCSIYWGVANNLWKLKNCPRVSLSCGPGLSLTGSCHVGNEKKKKITEVFPYQQPLQHDFFHLLPSVRTTHSIHVADRICLPGWYTCHGVWSVLTRKMESCRKCPSPLYSALREKSPSFGLWWESVFSISF